MEWGVNMARKPQITKEMILKAALKMLIRDGYDAINIKTLSKEIGCSTQPLVWHFKNMDDLRNALAEYAHTYANEIMRPTVEDGILAFKQVGIAYIKIALYDPHLFQFVFLNGSGCYPMGTKTMLAEDDDHAELIQMIAIQYELSEQCAAQYLQNTICYTHGLATFIATGMMQMSEQEILIWMEQASKQFFIQAKSNMKKSTR